MALARYRYLFCDLLTDRRICELALTDVTFDRRIIQPGSFQATIPIPNRKIAEKARRICPPPGDLSAGPGRTVVHVYRSGELWGTYLIWTATPQGDDRGRVKVELQGACLESYLHHVEIRTDQTYTAADQVSGIAAGLVNDMQSDPAADLGLTVTAPTVGTPLTEAYARSDAAYYGDQLEKLAQLGAGFEYMIRTYEVSGARVREWVASPKFGSGTVEHSFTRPGNIVSWTYPSDATDAATSYQARGDTVQDDVTATSAPLMSSIATTTDYLAAGWPRLDKTIDYSGETDKTKLDSYAAWWAATRPGVIRIPQATVRLPAKTSWSPGRLGDTARLIIVDDWWPLGDDRKPTFSRAWRVVGCGVTPVSRTSGQEEMTLIFEEAE